MAASILPPAETTFFDSNGAPLAGGLVYTYTPGTTIPKATWQDLSASVVNTNPITLDAAGRCLCFGVGSYRTVVYDSLGNLIWDKNTSDGPVSSAMLDIVNAASISLAEGLWAQGITNGSAPSGPVLGQRWYDNGDADAVVLNIYDGASWLAAATLNTVGHHWISTGSMHLQDDPSIATTPFAQAGATIYATGAVDVTTNHASNHEFAFSSTLINNVGGSTDVPTSKNKVAGYFAIQTDAGGGNGWALNGVLYLTSSSAAIGGQQVLELDIANNSGTHYGDGLGFTGIEQPAVFGIQNTGISTNRVTAAYAVFGNVGTADPLWNNGLVSGPFTIRQNFLADYSSAVRSILISGAHTYGLDFAGQTGEGANPAIAATFTEGAIRLGSQHKIQARNSADSANIVLLESNASDQAVLARTATAMRVANDVVFIEGMSLTTSYANDAAAAAGGVAIDQIYRNGSVLQIRVT